MRNDSNIKFIVLAAIGLATLAVNLTKTSIASYWRSKISEKSDDLNIKLKKTNNVWTNVTSTISAVAACIAVYYAYHAYLQTRRQADIAQNAFLESDRPIIYVSISSHIARGDVSDPMIEIINLGNKPAFLEYVEAQSTSFLPTETVPMQDQCVMMDETIIMPGKSINFQCPYKGPILPNRPEHFRGLVIYKVITIRRWRRKFDYLYSPIIDRWGHSGDLESNTDHQIDGSGNNVSNENY